ncbi:MAG TPA: two-component regulator propeller domain-containing protein [Luteitalea sp.]|nr:two-component regulator propeller domain-containing protein [Luteitalea sp.]
MLALLAPVVPAAALDGERQVSQYIVERWGVERGYPGGAVHGIAQSADGDLWLATDRGLVRFDGLTFRTLATPGAGVGVRRAALGVASDGTGTIWVRMQGPRLLRVRAGRLEEVELPGTIRGVVTSLASSNDGNMLAAPLGDGVLQYRDGRPQVRVPLTHLRSSFVVAMRESRAGTLWLGTRDAGVLGVTATGITSLVDELPDRKINALALDGRDRLWIATDRGLARWTAGTLTIPDLEVANREVALALTADRDGNVWAALGSHGVARITAAGRAARLPWDVERHGDATSVFEDREGTVWIGTSRGMIGVRDGVFASYTSAQGLPAGGAGPIAVDGVGRVWLAPPSGGLHWLADGRRHDVGDAALSRDVVYSIAPAPDGVWVGRQRGGLSRIRVEGRAVRVESITARQGLAENSVYAVHTPADGTVWAGTLSAGVSRLHDGAITTFTRADGLPSNTVTSMAHTPDGRLWVGTPSGVAVHDGRSWRILSTRDGLPAADVSALLADRDGTMWIGTSSGLAFSRQGRVRGVAPVPVLTSPVLGMSDDVTGHLWITTADAVVRVAIDRLQSPGLAETDLQRFDLSDGLPSTEGVPRHRTVVRDSGARVWLSLSRGLSSVDVAAFDRRPSRQPHTRIDSVVADDAVLDGPASRIVPAGTRRLTITFDDDGVALSERTLFRFRLDGFDAEWSAPTHSRTVAYTNLSPRAYAFRVMAVDDRGGAGPETRLDVTIRPAFWQTWWCAGLIAIVLSAGAAGMYRWRLRRIARRMTREFEARIAERTRVAQDLHDTLLQGCLAASMQLHLAVDRLPDEAASRPAFDRVLGLLTRVVDEGRSAVRGLRADVADDLERSLARVPVELAPSSAAAVRIVVEGQPRAWHPIARDEAYRIGREALANALRHAGASAIVVTVSYDARAARLSVRDDGRGMDDAMRRHGREGHWGLTGMQERAESIGATVRVLSREGAGTEVELVVPAAVAFVTTDLPAAKRWWHTSRRWRIRATSGSGS